MSSTVGERLSEAFSRVAAEDQIPLNPHARVADAAAEAMQEARQPPGSRDDWLRDRLDSASSALGQIERDTRELRGVIDGLLAEMRRRLAVATQQPSPTP